MNGGCSRCGAGVLFYLLVTPQSHRGDIPSSSAAFCGILPKLSELYSIFGYGWFGLGVHGGLFYSRYYLKFVQLQLQFVVEMLLNLKLMVRYYIHVIILRFTTAYHSDGHSYNLYERAREQQIQGNK